MSSIVVLTLALAGCKTTPPDQGAADELRIIGEVEQNLCESKEACEEMGVPETLCCASDSCLGGISKVGGRVTDTSSMSANHCRQKINNTFDSFCVSKKRPGDCTGDCDFGNCENSGAASNITAVLPTGTATLSVQRWDCTATTGFCGCRCRSGA